MFAFSSAGVFRFSTMAAVAVRYRRVPCGVHAQLFYCDCLRFVFRF